MFNDITEVENRNNDLEISSNLADHSAKYKKKKKKRKETSYFFVGNNGFTDPIVSPHFVLHNVLLASLIFGDKFSFAIIGLVRHYLFSFYLIVPLTVTLANCVEDF